MQRSQEKRVVQEGRPHDYLYDPNYTICSQRDFYKDAAIGARAGATIKIKPIFNSMFSERKYDRRMEACLVLPKPNILENFMPQHNISGVPIRPMENKCIPIRGVDPTGADRARFITSYAPESYHLARKAVDDNWEDEVENKQSARNKKRQFGHFVSRGVQTDYRESEAQTEPYTPEFRLPYPNAYPKVLALIKMTWGKGLPARLEDVVVIERALTRRMLEIGVHDAEDENDFERRVKLMEQLEAQQWADREKELNNIMLQKMDLVSKILSDLKNKTGYIHTMKMERAYDIKKKETIRKLAQIRHHYLRDLRRIEEKYLYRKKNNAKRDVVAEYLDFNSEVYKPLARNGANIDMMYKPPEYRFNDLLNFDDLECLTNDPDFIKHQLNFDAVKCSKRLEKTKISEKTRRLESKLVDIYNAFKNETTKKSKEDNSYNKQFITMNFISEAINRLSTPIIESPDIKQEQKVQCTINLQKIIRGKVVQNMMKKEITENMEEILQLKALHKQDPFGLNTTYGQALAQANLQEDRELQQEKQNEVTEIVDQLEGETIGRMLDFLDKEMVRLLDERKIHALMLLAERDRRMREATEAGRRQREEEERRVNDEIFRQIVGIHQSTVDLYLEDMYLEAINRTADTNARAYVQELAKTLNEAAYLTTQHDGDMEKEELAADLVHCFILPELNRLYQKDRLDTLGARYTMASKEVTDATFSAQGVINEAFENITPTTAIYEQMEFGDEIVGSAKIAAKNIIHGAVDAVLQQIYPRQSVHDSQEEEEEDDDD